MKKLFASWWWILPFLALAACGRQETASQQPSAEQSAAATAAQTPDAEQSPQTATPDAPETGAPVSETDEPVEPGAQPSEVQPSMRVGAAPSGPPTSARFREGAHYRKIVPAQPTSAPPGEVEVVEVFWYGCSHCFALEPALESWRGNGKPAYVQFVRVPAMWNDMTRMHARLYYAAEALGKLEDVHSLIFREIHVKNNLLNTMDSITAFFRQHGVSAEELNKAFSSFAVESKLQRADFLNRRYRVDSVPVFIVNGKYKTDLGDAGGEASLIDLIGELAAHEHGG
jgi:protein dithiol oxidoreductase (disulfide-forming)